jgi:hypothetical protein
MVNFINRWWVKGHNFEADLDEAPAFSIILLDEIIPNFITAPVSVSIRSMEGNINNPALTLFERGGQQAPCIGPPQNNGRRCLKQGNSAASLDYVDGTLSMYLLRAAKLRRTSAISVHAAYLYRLASSWKEDGNWM